MALIQIENEASYNCAENDTLLRAGLRAGLGLPYECNAGGCGTCKVELLEGEVEQLWPEAPGLSERDRRKRRVLACQCRPLGDCRIKLRLDPACVPATPPTSRPAVLVGVRSITHDIREFSFQSEGAAQFLPGQYAMVELPGEGPRAYSLANTANEAGHWQFQIRLVPGGRISTRLFERPPTSIVLDGPFGLAYLQPGERNVVCLAGGSGLAPMLSIARGIAANPADTRHVHFFHGGRTLLDLLDETVLRDLVGLGTRLSYHPVLSSETRPGISSGFVHEAAQQWLRGREDEFDYYCAGPPPMTQAVEAMLITDAGLPESRLRFDRFF